MTGQEEQKEKSAQEPHGINETVQTERRSSLPVIFSVLAMLIAAMALAVNIFANKPAQTDPLQTISSKLGQIEARIGDVEAQMTNDKLDVVNIQLKQILLQLQQLSQIADSSTRERIDRAYKLLEPLAAPATRIKVEIDLPEIDAQTTAEPENKNGELPATAVENITDDMPPAADVLPENDVSPDSNLPTSHDAAETPHSQPE
ncbi:MAG: hypothetical protein R8K53_06220 [Mariprofundaceae bacterium]